MLRAILDALNGSGSYQYIRISTLVELHQDPQGTVTAPPSRRDGPTARLHHEELPRGKEFVSLAYHATEDVAEECGYEDDEAIAELKREVLGDSQPGR